MRSVLEIVGVLLAIFVAITIVTGTSLVGEVVTLHTKTADGSWKTTSLWIVDADKGSYLRTASTDNRLADSGAHDIGSATRAVRVARQRTPRRRSGDAQVRQRPDGRQVRLGGRFRLTDGRAIAICW